MSRRNLVSVIGQDRIASVIGLRGIVFGLVVVAATIGLLLFQILIESFGLVDGFHRFSSIRSWPNESLVSRLERLKIRDVLGGLKLEKSESPLEVVVNDAKERVVVGDLQEVVGVVFNQKVAIVTISIKKATIRNSKVDNYNVSFRPVIELVWFDLDTL